MGHLFPNATSGFIRGCLWSENSPAKVCKGIGELAEVKTSVRNWSRCVAYTEGIPAPCLPAAGVVSTVSAGGGVGVNWGSREAQQLRSQNGCAPQHGTYHYFCTVLSTGSEIN